MFVIRNKKIFLLIGAGLVLLSILMTAFLGLEFSNEFVGGTIIEVSYEEQPSQDVVMSSLEGIVDVSTITIQPSQETNYILRTPFLEEDVQNEVIASLQSLGQGVEIERISSVGPIIGQELRQKSLWAIILVIIAIVLFIAFAFRKVSEPVSSWKYGVVAIAALIHDILLPTAAFALLGYFLGFQVDVLFITALLAILGFSVNDTIVVFDRIRENLRHNDEVGLKEDFKETVGRSLSQTFARSINTSLTTLLPLILLLFIGSESTRHFALVLVIGIIAGTYSSLFIASPLLVFWNKKNE